MPLVDPSSDQSAWFCLKSQPRRERHARQCLETLPGVNPFAPTARYPRQSAKRKTLASEAVFPGYLFARFVPRDSARQVQYSQGVAYIVKRGDQLVALPDAILDELRVLAPEGVLDLSPRPLCPGEQVRLVQGIFTGTQAKVVALAPASDRVKVLLEILGREQEILLPLDTVERAFENPFAD